MTPALIHNLDTALHELYCAAAAVTALAVLVEQHAHGRHSATHLHQVWAAVEAACTTLEYGYWARSLGRAEVSVGLFLVLEQRKVA